MSLRKLSIYFALSTVIMYGQAARETPSNYVLGPDDQISIQAVDVEEISGKPVRIDMRGNINLAMIGRIQAAGETADSLEVLIKKRLEKYVREPDVSVSIVEYRSQPISVLGQVMTPGVHQIQGHKSLFEVLSLAGGLKLDAGYSVKITRRLEWGRIPLPGAADDPSGQFSVASINIKGIMDASNPAGNIAVKPEDVITVPKAELIYVIGTVRKPGGFVLGENETRSALEVLAMAEGLDRFAASKDAKIMRLVPGSPKRAEIPINLKLLLAGKIGDIPLQAEDILFVPTSLKKAATVRGIESALQIGTGLAIYRP